MIFAHIGLWTWPSLQGMLSIWPPFACQWPFEFESSISGIQHRQKKQDEAILACCGYSIAWSWSRIEPSASRLGAKDEKWANN